MKKSCNGCGYEFDESDSYFENKDNDEDTLCDLCHSEEVGDIRDIDSEEEMMENEMNIFHYREVVK